VPAADCSGLLGHTDLPIIPQFRIEGKTRMEDVEKPERCGTRQHSCPCERSHGQGEVPALGPGAKHAALWIARCGILARNCPFLKLNTRADREKGSLQRLL